MHDILHGDPLPHHQIYKSANNIFAVAILDTTANLIPTNISL
jgi:hypothetical protein